MALISFIEVFDMLLMTFVVGFIFMDIFKVPRLVGFQWRALLWAALVTAPAIILHEFGHKFVAIGFGQEAVFHAAYVWLAIGVFLKLIRSPFIFFVPGFVTVPVTLAAMPLALVAFAGPAVNGILYMISIFVLLKYGKNLSNKARIMWIFTRRINGFLFILNMLPIPGFDGFKVFGGLFGFFF